MSDATAAYFSQTHTIIVNEDPFVTDPYELLQINNDCGYTPTWDLSSLPNFVTHDESTGTFTIDPQYGDLTGQVEFNAIASIEYDGIVK